MNNEIKVKYQESFETLQDELIFFNDMFQDLNEPTLEQLEHMYQLDLIENLLIDDGQKQVARIYVVATNEFVYVSNDKFLELQETDLKFEYAPF
tara:strand:+ start:246 stop:527 length:282 start_codon:yes stop_codon:yes gene_type:complete